MAGNGAQAEVRAVLDQLIEAQNAGDAGRVRSLLSGRPEAVHIGTDAEEWWTSEQVADSVAAFTGTGDDLRVVIDDLDVHLQGDVAWAEGHVRFSGLDGAEQLVRVTGVLVQEDGQWKVVQSHSSIGVPNADMFG